MAALSPNKIAWVYHDNDGTEYVVAAQKAITDQLVCGGHISDGSEPPLPVGFKMRRMNCYDAAGHKRAIVCYDVAATAWTVKGTAINLNYMNESTPFVTSGVKRSESFPRRAPIGDLT